VAHQESTIFYARHYFSFFEKMLAGKGYEIFMDNMKVKIPNENIYYYPDILVTREL